MTIDGGKPHAVGDRGQRYEVSFFNPSTNKREVFGWAESRTGVAAMVRSIDLHPTWSHPEVKDRKGNK